jgi:cysteinyl-tRNA synthetase
LNRYDGETVRFFMLRTHYRSPFNFSDANLDDARQALRRLYTALDVGLGDTLPADETSIDWSLPQAAAFRAAMDDDFNTPAAMAQLFDLAGEVNRGRDRGAAQQLRALGRALGLLQQPPRQYLQAGAGLDEAEIQAQIGERAAAKARRDFAEADRIRLALSARGIELKDSAQGTSQPWSPPDDFGAVRACRRFGAGLLG